MTDIKRACGTCKYWMNKNNCKLEAQGSFRTGNSVACSEYLRDTVWYPLPPEKK